MFLHKLNYVVPPFVPQGNADLVVPLSPVRFGTGSLRILRGFGQDYGGVTYSNLANTIGSGNFTAECWVYAQNPNIGFSELNNFLGFSPSMTVNATYKAVPGNPPTYQYSYTVSTGTYQSSFQNVYMGFWGYVCLMRFNGKVYFFSDPGLLNNLSVPIPSNGATLDSNNVLGIPNSDLVGTNFLVGCNQSLTKGFNGYIDQVRVSNIARYSSAITSGLNQYQVPQSQFTVDANTVLLAGYNGTFANQV